MLSDDYDSGSYIKQLSFPYSLSKIFTFSKSGIDVLASCTAKDCMTECLELTAEREMAYNLALCSCMGGKDITGKAMQIETQYLEMSSIVRYMSCSRYFTGNVCVYALYM